MTALDVHICCDDDATVGRGHDGSVITRTDDDGTIGSSGESAAQSLDDPRNQAELP
jgi:hypothetical protein